MLAPMPGHDDLGSDDFPFLRKSMRATLAVVHERLMMNVNVPALAAALAAALTRR
jgi:hypothetical protein